MTSTRLGGIALIFGALAFMAVFAWLAANFGYPEVLDGTAATVLPSLLAMGSTGRGVWAIYGFLPLIWIPAGVGAYRALKTTHPGLMLLALQFTLLSAISMMLGLLRWPTIQWRLAQLYVTTGPEQHQIIEAIFDGVNVYLGNYLGEFLGELSFSSFFVICGYVLLRSRRHAPGWGIAGIATGVMGFAGMFRNVTPLAGPVAGFNNFLLPIWMIAFGVFLIRYRENRRRKGTKAPEIALGMPGL